MIEVLAAPSTGDKSTLLLLLGSLARGQGYMDQHRGVLPNEHLEALGGGKQAERERRWVSATEAAVSAGVAVLARHLDHADPELRGAAACALGGCRSKSAEVIPILAARLETERDSRTRTALGYAIGSLGALPEEPPLEGVLRWPPADPVRIGATIGLALHSRAELTIDAVPSLVEALVQDRHDVVAEPYLDGDLSGLALRALDALSDASMKELRVRMLPLLSTLDPGMRDYVGDAFSERHGRP